MEFPNFKLIMLSAMYENGGNTTHRMLDGHPQLFVYPFESQVGTKFVNDYYSSLYPNKYRWPEFPTDLEPEMMFQLIIDEEAKVRARTPQVSKFRTADFQLNDDERKARFSELLKGKKLNRANAIAAFFIATFECWKNYQRSGQESFYVGYSPIIGIDAKKIFQDISSAYVLHIVRNPFSAFAETCKRPVPLSLDHYMTGWVNCQLSAIRFAEQFPDRFLILRYEDLINDPKEALVGKLQTLGIQAHNSLNQPSWNASPLEQIYPWGTIQFPKPAVNLETAQKLMSQQIQQIKDFSKPILNYFDYQNWLS